METHKGKVWLVGAGPGAGGLMTLRGRQVLQQAEVVIYDSLIGPEILAMIPEHAKCIYAGKRSGHHTMPQEDINQTIAEEALQGQRVVRLKGGDPFLFGRGGEELELLCERGIPYEVVPGIPSPLAVPAYFGIPVTHRDWASSLHIVTGHRRKGETYDIDFDALVKMGGTLVFLMGVAALPQICKGLLEAGMNPEMPAAILEKGTTARQRQIAETVGTLEAAARKQKAGTPAIIVVGEVCRLAKDFSWRDALPLAGRRILVTRPAGAGSQMSGKLRVQGAEVLEFPGIETCPFPENQQLREAIEQIHTYHWIVFTSPRGVDVFMEALLAGGKDARSLAGAKFAVIGPGTGRALSARGIKADLMPPVYDSRSLGEALVASCETHATLLLPRAELGSRELTETLAARADLTVTEIPIYSTRFITEHPLDEKQAFERGEIDCAVFTSVSTVTAFVGATPGLDYGLVKAACIGERTAEAARQAGMEVYVSEKATMDSLTDRVSEILT